MWSSLDTCPHGHTLLRRHTAKHEIKNNEKNKDLKKSNGELQFTHQVLAEEIQSQAETAMTLRLWPIRVSYV